MEITNQVAPFSWILHDDGKASVTLYTDCYYKNKLFETRQNEGFVGSGYDWESLATVFIQEMIPELHDVINFDPEYLMFCAYSSNAEALKQFILMFMEACNDNDLIADIFSRAKPQKPITEEDFRRAFEKMGIDAG